MVRKTKLYLVGLLFILVVLSACGNKEEPKTNEPENESSENKENNEKDDVEDKDKENNEPAITEDETIKDPETKKADKEIKQISKDIILINDELQLAFEKKMGEYSADKIDDADYEAFLKDEIIPQTEEVKEYLADYEEPSSDLAKQYYDVAHPYITVSNDILLTLGEEQLVGVKGDMTVELAAEYDAELQEMVVDYDDLREKLIELEETLEEEHGIRFDIVD